MHLRRGGIYNDHFTKGSPWGLPVKESVKISRHIVKLWHK